MTELAGIDGVVPAAQLDRDPCCAVSLCQINPSDLICTFIQALPRGPLWDRAKAEAMDRYQGGLDIGCGEDPCLRPACASLVDHSIYTAKKLIDGLFGALYPALRESDPFTAHDTLDEWLLRYGWWDCYSCACRLADHPIPSPIEVLDGQGNPVCAVPDYPDDLQRAVKRGIVIALERLSLGPRRNLDAMNFVIAALGAKISPVCFRDLALDPTQCNNDDGLTLCHPPEPDYACDTVTELYRCGEVDDCPGHDTLGARCHPIMRQFTFCISPSRQTLPKAVKIDCFDSTFRTYFNVPWDMALAAPIDNPYTVQAYYEPGPGDAEGLPDRIYPGVLAAECIVRAMMPLGAKIRIIRGDPVAAESISTGAPTLGTPTLSVS